MDGKELVNDAGTLGFEENAPSMRSPLNERAATPESPTPIRPPASQATRWQSRSFAFAAVAGLVLAALLFGVYYALTHRPRSGNANQASGQTSVQSPGQSPDQSTARATDAQVPASPVSAGGAAKDSRAPVIIWLTNGASIKADEVWAGREGIWYRQAGMVTFLKRSQVKAIRRLAPRSKSTASNAEEKNQKPENSTAQNQPRIAKAEPTEAKKESRVSSFLKKTGRILKKPFKL
jgi:hypothetical protein